MPFAGCLLYALLGFSREEIDRFDQFLSSNSDFSGYGRSNR